MFIVLGVYIYNFSGRNNVLSFPQQIHVFQIKWKEN